MRQSLSPKREQGAYQKYKDRPDTYRKIYGDSCFVGIMALVFYLTFGVIGAFLSGILGYGN